VLRTLWRVMSVALAVLLGASGAVVLARQAASAPTGSVLVVVNYADGRRASITVGPTSGGMWTATFPRLSSWTPPPNQLPASAINFVCARTPEGVVVSVSVFRGSPHQQEDPIATVLVTPTASVVVDQLRSVGVQPVTLSLTSLSTPHLTPPAVTTASPLLAVIDVRAMESPVPKYTATLRNNAVKSVRSLRMEASRGGHPAVSAQRRGHEGAPLIAPNDTYAIDVPESVGSPGRNGLPIAPAIDLVAISAVTWTDGSYDGDQAAAVMMLVSDLGELVQLGRVTTELEHARAAGPAATPGMLRAGVDGLPIDVTPEMIDDARSRVRNASVLPADRMAVALRSSLQSVKKTFLDDLTDFDSGRSAPGAFEGWLNSAINRCQRWSGLLSR
jgi:hypothetical protein